MRHSCVWVLYWRLLHGWRLLHKKIKTTSHLTHSTQVYGLYQIFKALPNNQRGSLHLERLLRWRRSVEEVGQSEKGNRRVNSAHPLSGTRLTSEAPGVKPSVSSTIPASSSCSRARKSAAGSSSKAVGCPVSSMSAIFSLSSKTTPLVFQLPVW